MDPGNGVRDSWLKHRPCAWGYNCSVSLADGVLPAKMDAAYPSILSEVTVPRGEDQRTEDSGSSVHRMLHSGAAASEKAGLPTD